jgi:hypothetical protein
MTFHRLVFRITTACLLVAGSAAFADTTVRYALPDGSITIERSDDGRLRASADEQTWLLIADGRLYSVNTTKKGLADVLDVTAIGEALRKELAALPNDQPSDPPYRQVTRLERQATIAGITGQEYRIRFSDERNSGDYAAVGSAAAQIAPVAETIDAFIAALQEQGTKVAPQYAEAIAGGIKDFAVLQREIGTILSFGEGRERIALESFSTSPIDPQRFTLPVAPRDPGREVAMMRRVLRTMKWFAR